MNVERPTPPEKQYKITERQLDAMADKLGSYDLAYAHFDVTRDEVEPEQPKIAELEQTPPPIAVNLVNRAHALEDIMTYLNKASQTRGSATQLGRLGSEFRRRYGAEAEQSPTRC